MSSTYIKTLKDVNNNQICPRTKVSAITDNSGTGLDSILDLKQNITDNTLATTSKTVAGAINELNTNKVAKTITVNGHALSSNVTVTATDVGLGNVNNTSDANKPVSTAQQSALDLKQNITDNSLATTAKTVVGAINELNTNKVTNTTTVNGHALSANVTVTATDIGLGNVDNTSDANKPISTAQQTALDLKQNITDNSLTTTDKTIVGAINEIKVSIPDAPSADGVYLLQCAVTSGTPVYSWVYNPNLVGDKPNTSVSYVYDGTEKTNGYTKPDHVTMTGNDRGTNAGTYVATYTPDKGYAWNDGTTTAVAVTLTIKGNVGPKPTNLTPSAAYTGSEITNGYIKPDHVTMTGNDRGITPGNYSAVYTPDTNYAWSDGTDDAVTITLTIREAWDTRPLTAAEFDAEPITWEVI